VSPDNRWAYVANTRDDRISVVDLERWALDGEIRAGDEPDGMAWLSR
jgi:YVTN family beta-propeller protein